MGISVYIFLSNISLRPFKITNWTIRRTIRIRRENIFSPPEFRFNHS